MAQAPITSVSSDKFRRGFGLDPIKPDMPLGTAVSLVAHLGIVLSALLAWQATPRITPEDVIAVDVVSDTLSVLGENTAAETAQTGVDTPNPSPLEQTSPPSSSQDLPQESLPTQTLPQESFPQDPLPQNLPPQAQESQAAPAVPSAAAPALPPPPPAKNTPTLPARKAPAPAPAPAAAPAPKAPAPKAPAKAKVAQRQAGPAPLPEFDLAAASTAATGADSGGRRSPQLASRGKAGRLGKAGGGAEVTGDLEAALRAQLKRCWLPPADMSNPRQLIVVISIDLGIDGQLLRQPVLVSPASAEGASQRLVVAIDNAKRAVNGCEPFNLPPDRYDSWRQVRFKFDPELMTRR